MRAGTVAASALLVCLAVSCTHGSPRTVLGSAGSSGPKASASPLSTSSQTASLVVSALAHGSWRRLPRSPLGDRDSPVLVWDGREVLEIGGTARRIAQPDGVAFDPVTSTWRRIATAPGRIGAAGEAAVWTGRQVFLFGGQTAPRGSGMLSCCVAGLYDPVRNAWSTSSAAPTGELAQVTAVWTGATIVVAGVREDGHMVAATYNPADDHWSGIDPSLPVAH